MIGLQEGIIHFFIQEDFHYKNAHNNIYLENKEKEKLYYKNQKIIKKLLQKSMKNSSII